MDESPQQGGPEMPLDIDEELSLIERVERCCASGPQGLRRRAAMQGRGDMEDFKADFDGDDY